MFIDDEGPTEPVSAESLLAHLEAIRDSSGSRVLLTPLIAIHENTLAAMISVLKDR